VRDTGTGIEKVLKSSTVSVKDVRSGLIGEREALGAITVGARASFASEAEFGRWRDADDDEDVDTEVVVAEAAEAALEGATVGTEGEFNESADIESLTDGGSDDDAVEEDTRAGAAPGAVGSDMAMGAMQLGQSRHFHQTCALDNARGSVESYRLS